MSLLKRIGRFAVVGVLCLVLQYCIMYTLVRSLNLVAAEIVAFLLAAQLNFVLSQKWTWGDRQCTEPLHQRWFKFNANAVASVIVINATVFWFLTSIGLWYWSAMIFANVSSTMFTFLMNHFIVFRKKPSPVPTNPEERIVSVNVESAAFFLPAHNEALNLPTIVERVHAFFDNAGVEERTVIIVDDGSTDNTQEVIERIKITHPVIVITHEVNRGYGGALRSGFAAALDTGHDWIAFCDSDGQFDPYDAQLLFDAAHHHDVKVVFGYRAQRADSMKRRIAGRTWHKLSQSVLRFNATDIDCGFKLFHRDTLHEVAPKLRGNHATISPELTSRLQHAGHKFTEVAIPHYPRSHGQQSGMKLHVMVGSVLGLIPLRRDIYTKENS